MMDCTSRRYSTSIIDETKRETKYPAASYPVVESQFSLLIVDDEPDFCDATRRWMEHKGHRVVAASSGAEAIEYCRQLSFDVALLDLDMPGMNGIELLQRMRDSESDVEIIMLTGRGSIETAVQAMKMGACDFLTKPCPLGDVEHHCQLALERARLRKENRQLKAVISRAQPNLSLIGKSPRMLEVGKLVDRVAPTDKPVLITGESGTGKEVIAKNIQEKSGLANKPFVTVNCAALPEQLVESELFGHQKGSFTGATAEKPGLFEVADGGTLFIDELGELPLALQPKLLRVLEDGSMRRVGSAKERRVNVRIITATNRDLKQDILDGRFREDLYYRVNVLTIELPALRDRAEDIPLLIEHFLPDSWRIDSKARLAMLEYRWPGNVRELINVIQRATILADHNEITLDDLPREIADAFQPSASERSTSDTDSGPVQVTPAAQESQVASVDRLENMTRKHVLAVLHREKGNKASAARSLGIHRRKLYRLLERFGTEATDLDCVSESA